MNFRVTVLSLLAFAVIFVLAVVSGFSATNTSSPAGQFNVTPSIVYFNWTTSPQYTANVTLALNNVTSLNTTNVTIIVLNSSYFIGNYSQSIQAPCTQILVLVQNRTGGYTTTTETLNYSSTVNSTTLTLSPNLAVINGASCVPGRYTLQNKLLISNSTNPSSTSENVTIDGILDLPITTNTTLNSSSGIGTFNGKLPPNATAYQSFYFYTNNATTIANATGATVTINWGNSSQYVSLYLLDGSGTLKAKSIQNGTTSQTLQYNFLPTSSAVWEIRVYGNSSSQISYSGSLYFTTLNVTNSSTPNQQITQINFGTLNVSASQTTNIILTNPGPLNLSTITQSSDLYYVKSFTGSSVQNFTMLVPNSSTINAVNVTLDWANATGAGNYSLTVLDNLGNTLGTSVNKFVNANVSGTTEEEFVNIAPPSSSQVLTFKVVNGSTILPSYNLTVKLMYPASSWISTNYSSMSFISGNSSNVQVNLTTQNVSLDGSYQGDLYYLDPNGAGLQIPIIFNVSAPSLSVNNSFDAQTIRIDEDYGATLTKTLNIYVNNSGSVGAFLNMTLNSTNLTCTSGNCAGYNATLAYNPTNFISANSGIPIQINTTFTSSMPTGLYTGWIFFNATNTTTAFASHPSSTLNLTIQLNLTNLLNIKLVELDTPTGLNTFNNISTGGNISLKMNITYLNGTSTGSYSITPSNFSAVWITEGNATSFGITSSDNVTLSNLVNTTGPLYNPSGNPSGYWLNATIPANTSGGNYFVNTRLNIGPNSDFNGTFTGSLSNQSLTVTNTGLYLSTPVGNSSIATIPSTGTTTTVYVNVTNVGPLAGSGDTLSLGTCTGWSIVSGPTPATISPAAYSTNTIVSWVVGNTTTNSTDCPTNITGSTPTGIWFNSLPVTFHLASPYTSTTTTTTTTTTTPTYLSIVSYPSLIRVLQGSSNSTNVIVSNTNTNSTQTVTLSVTGINSSWVSVTPAQTISPGAQATYTTTFTIPANASVQDYSANFQAVSSLSTVTQAFTLRVLPTNVTQALITANFTQILANYTQVWQLYNQSKAAGVNLTNVDPLFTSLQTQIQQAQNDIAQGTPEGYFQAQQLFSNIQSLISATQQALQQAQPPAPNYLLYGIIIAAVLGGLFVVYLFLPSKSPPTKKETVS